MKLVREHIYEFTDDSDPIKDLGIGKTYFIYDIVKDENGNYEFMTNKPLIKEFIRQNISGISDNEIKRFMTFTLQDIYDDIPLWLFDNKDEKRIDERIKREIKNYAPNWMALNSDSAMKIIFNRSK